MFLSNSKYRITQILSLLALTLFSSIFNTLSRSQKTSLLNNLEIFNEIMIMGVTSSIVLFTDYVPTGDL